MCPNRCSFCCSSLLEKIYADNGTLIRRMSIKAIIKELKYYKNKFSKLRFIWFTDDTMFIRTMQELELFAREYKEKIDRPFLCYTSPNTFKKKA